jgi:hypothetical protein
MTAKAGRWLAVALFFSVAASVQPTLALIVARCNGRATGRPWSPPLAAAALSEQTHAR